MSTHKLLVLLNRDAGGGDQLSLEETLQRTLEPAQIPYAVTELSAETDLDTLISDAVADGYTLIVAAGGDGTVSAVANALLGHDVLLAILPCGTANLLARDLQIPLQLAEATQLLLNPKQIATVDMMRCGDQTFISHVSLGTYAQIAQRTATSVEAKRLYGRLIYVWHAFWELHRQQIWPFRITLDGQRYTVRASLVMCANIGTVGIGDWQWGEDITPTDGVINLCIVQAKTPVEYLSFLWYMARHATQQAPTTRFLRAQKSIQIECDQPIPIRGDGEIIGKSSIQLEILSGALKVVVPA